MHVKTRAYLDEHLGNRGRKVHDTRRIERTNNKNKLHINGKTTRFYQGYKYEPLGRGHGNPGDRLATTQQGPAQHQGAQQQQ